MARGLDVLLAHGYFLAEDEHERQVMKPHPPLGLLYLSAYLKQRGHSVLVFDSTFRTFAEWESTLEQARPRVLGLYGNLLTRARLLEMIALGRAAGARVVLGGPEPAPHAAEYLARGADVVVEGEGEAALDELLLLAWQDPDHELARVRGIVWRDAAGALRRNPPRAQLPDLDALPLPDRGAIDLPRYLATWRRHHGYGTASLITARGCPYTCTWCSHAVYGTSHRRRSAAAVADEVAHLVERYAPERLWYADDVFTIHRGFVLGLRDELQRRRLRLPFECISRADRIDEPVADALAQMGCYRLWLGAESGSQRVLDAMKRKTTVPDLQAKTALLQSRSIEVGMFIMLGYEGEEQEDLQATADHLKAARPDVFLTTVAYPIAGTEYHRDLGARVSSSRPWHLRTDRELAVAGRRSRRFYLHATRWLVHEVANARERARGHGWRALRHRLAALRGRLGMAWRRNDREHAEDYAGGAAAP